MILWPAPVAKDVVLKVATPPLRVTVPRVVVPSSKVTLPVGVPPPGLAAPTVAVKVIDCPYNDGFVAEVSVTLELA